MNKTTEPKTTVTKKGFVPIYRGDDYGARKLDVTSDIIYETEKGCLNDCETDQNFLAVGTLTWEEEVDE